MDSKNIKNCEGVNMGNQKSEFDSPRRAGYNYEPSPKDIIDQAESEWFVFKFNNERRIRAESKVEKQRIYNKYGVWV